MIVISKCWEIWLGHDMSNTLYNCLKSYILLSLIFVAFSGVAYRANAKREADDPQKKEFNPAAIPLAPLWPLFILMSILLFIIRVVVHAFFLIFFALALVAFRKPFLLTWLQKMAVKIGNKLLMANTYLIKLFFPHAGSKSI